MNEHEKQRRAVWADAYMRCALGERIATREQVLKFADMLLAEFDKRFPAPAQPAAHGYVPAPSDSRVEQQVRITDSADAQEIAKSLDRAIEQLRGSVFSPVNVTEAVYKEYQRQAREQVAAPKITVGLRLSSDRPVNDGVTTTNYRLNEAEREDWEVREPAKKPDTDAMWKASKAFDGSM